MRHAHSVRFCALAIAALAVSACNDDPTFNFPDAFFGDAGADAGDASTGDAGDDAADDGTTDSGCATDADCPADAPVCEGGTCVECRVDADCAEGEACVDLACSDDASVCEAGATSCDGNVLVTCEEDGAAEARTDCGDQFCVEAGGAASCEAQRCEPFASGCLDASAAFLCNDDGSDFEVFACEEGFACDAGACRVLVCEPGVVACDADRLVTCNDTGTERDVVACDDTEACAASPLGCACVDAACEPRVCVPGTGRCVGQAAQACADDGLGYLDPVSCDEGVCLAGECLPASCEPGASECAGDVALICNPDGESRDEVDCRAADLICIEGDEGAGCDLPVCPANARRCAPLDAIGEALLICDPRGASERIEPCEEGEFCDAGSCLAQVCDPRDPAICLDGAVALCNARGSDFLIVEECGEGEACVLGACVERVCEPGSVVCEGDELVTCDEAGLDATRRDCQAGSAYCNAGACVPWECDPSEAPSCVGGDVFGCNERGSARQELAACGEAGCEDGACLSRCGDGVVDRGEECDDGDANGVGVCTESCTLDPVSGCEGVDGPCGVASPGEVLVTELDVVVDASDLDVAIVMDVTGSMATQIAALQDGFRSTIVPELRSLVPGIWFGVSEFRDVPCGGFGAEDDLPFTLLQRVTSDVDEVNRALDFLVARGGADLDESLLEALYQVATGNGRDEPGCVTTAAFDAEDEFLEGVADGVEGGMGFREASRRVALVITDAPSQAKGEGGYTTGATRVEAADALRRSGVRVAGMISGASSAARDELGTISADTESTVPTCAWDGARPPGCDVGECCTGAGGAGEDALDGECPLVYRFTGVDGELQNTLVDGVRAAANFSTWDVTIRASGAFGPPACVLRDVRAIRAEADDTSCLPAPTVTDVRPGVEGDGFTQVRTGTQLTFEVELDPTCLPIADTPQFIDVPLEVVSADGYVITRATGRVLIPATVLEGTCGDGVVDGDEECDDGNRDDNDLCSNSCRATFCGDGIVQSAFDAERTFVRPALRTLAGDRVCDDGASCPQQSCSLLDRPDAPEHGICQQLGYDVARSAVWGDDTFDASAVTWATEFICFDYDCSTRTNPNPAACGAHELLSELVCVGQGEQCDEGDANADLPDRCRADCQLPRCGDGIVDSGEACDDGNATPGDGCESTCVESVDALRCPSIDLGSSTGEAIAFGPMNIHDDSTTGSCGGAGPDVILSWTAPLTGRYNFRTNGGEADTILYIREAPGGTCDGVELACNDNDPGTFFTTLSDIEVNVVAGALYAIVVDTQSPDDSVSSWTLNIQRL